MLAEKIEKLLERLTCSNSETVGKEWQTLAKQTVEAVRDLERRLAALEAKPANTLHMPGKR